MKVSVIVPVYNAKDYIVHTVDLLKKQTLQDIEIILVDDGSTDGSARLCDALMETDSRIKVLHTPNEGVSAARNKGIAIASGAYIGFADADDEPSLTLYETLYHNAVENNCQISCAKYAMQYINGKIINDGGSGNLHIYQSRSDLIRDFLLENIRPGIYTSLIKRDVCSLIAFEEGRRIYEDKKYIWDAICHADSWCFMDKCLYNYVKRKGSATTGSFSDKYLDALYFAEKMEQKLQAEYPDLESFGKVYTIKTHLLILQKLISSSQTKDYIKLFRDSSDYLRKFQISFCRKYLNRNGFIKWLGIKIHPSVFYVIIKIFANS